VYVVVALFAPTIIATAAGVGVARFERLIVPAPAKPCTVIAAIPEATLTIELSVNVPVPRAVSLPKVKVPPETVVPPL
jgi:hypothetical protein